MKRKLLARVAAITVFSAMAGSAYAQGTPAGQTDPAQGGQGYTSAGDPCIPGSKTGLQLDRNYVPNRQEPAINEMRTSDTCGT
ncbi:hypothetical protein [Bordetella tumulicola]|uniref:hypothetical protein n=1 Tax=Bordetella tumulicola TaxID=1649133 RepID=UPI0039F01A71